VTIKRKDVSSMVIQFSIGFNQFIAQTCRHIADEYDRLDSHIHRDTLLNWFFAELRLSRVRATTKDLIAADKAKKVEAITMQISDPMSYKDSAKFWQLLHSAVPSLNKKTSIQPIASLKLEDGSMATDYNSIRARWQRHFASIELGKILNYDDLCQKVRAARTHTHCPSLHSLIARPFSIPRKPAIVSKSDQQQGRIASLEFCFDILLPRYRDSWARFTSNRLLLHKSHSRSKNRHRPNCLKAKENNRRLATAGGSLVLTPFPNLIT